MPTPPPSIPSAADRAARQMGMLRELAELGMELARALGAQALAELSPTDETPDAPKVTTADPVLMFTRVARAVRQTVALEMRIGRADEADQAQDDRALARYEQLARKTLVHEIATEAVRAQAGDHDCERLLDRLEDRIDYERREADDFSFQPISVLVTRICHDLGVQPDWSAWAEAADEDAPDGPPPPTILARENGRQADMEHPPPRR
jgi:hypothetical protein